MDREDNYSTTISFGGGERNVLLGSFRTEGKMIDNSDGDGISVGYKISGSFMTGDDFEFDDPAEPDSVILGIQTTDGRKNPDGTDFDGTEEPIDNARDYRIHNNNIDGRFDLRFNDHTELILSAGHNDFSGIELTGIGAAQGKNWTYSYGQVRFKYKDLFAQAYVNASNSGDTYLLRSGDLIIDKSKFISGQIQHSTTFAEKLRLTYGLDALLTRPDTDGTINGSNEDDDDIDEFGGYLQAELDLSQKVNIVAAMRIDDHTYVDEPIVSPRAGIVYKPNSTQNFRATYNRAFDSPNALVTSLDILSEPDVFGFMDAGLPSGTDVRASSNRGGFIFSRNVNGVVQFRSPFASLVGGSPSDYYDLNDLTMSNATWGVAKSGTDSHLEQLMQANGVPQSTIDNLFNSYVPGSVAGVSHILMMLNTEDPDNPFNPDKLIDPSDVVDLDPVSHSVTQTFEIGYNGVIKDKFAIGLDVYRTEITDFISALAVETPNVFLNPDDLAGYLGTQLGTALNDPANAFDNGWLTAFFDPVANGGNGNGTAVDELTAIYTGAAAQIPFGTVNPVTANDPSVILTYKNFGDVTLYGVDLSATYYVREYFKLGATYSYADKDSFLVEGSENTYIALNAPKHKLSGSANYEFENIGLLLGLRFRWQNEFPVRSGVYNGRVDAFHTFDFSVVYALPFSENTKVSVNVMNFTDNVHQEFVGAAEIGRLALFRISHIF